MAFAENETLAHLYAEALRADGFRVIVRPVGGLRPEAVAKIRSRQIDVYPAYDGSLLRYLVGTSPARLKAGLKRTLARIGAEPLRLSRAQNRNVFVAKTDTASRLGLARISDLSRYWQTAGQ
jgi:osmoprotectant transport system substrate-binding protein